LQSKLSQGLAKKVKDQIDDAQEALARAKVSEVEQEEEFFDLLEDEVDTSKALEKKLTLEKKQSQVWSAKERAKKPSASLKVYFSVERMQVML
jgi:hypothetical protein